MSVNLCCLMLWHLKCDHSCVRELSGNANCETNSHLSHEFHMLDSYMEGLVKPQNCQNWVGGHLHRNGCLLGAVQFLL